MGPLPKMQRTPFCIPFYEPKLLAVRGKLSLYHASDYLTFRVETYDGVSTFHRVKQQACAWIALPSLQCYIFASSHFTASLLSSPPFSSLLSTDLLLSYGRRKPDRQIDVSRRNVQLCRDRRCDGHVTNRRIRVHVLDSRK